MQLTTMSILPDVASAALSWRLYETHTNHDALSVLRLYQASSVTCLDGLPVANAVFTLEPIQANEQPI